MKGCVMNRNFKYYVAIWAVLFVVFNAVLFIVAANTGGIDGRGASFWVSYVLVIASFAGQFLCAKTAFSGDTKKLFYGLPLLQVSYTCLVVSVIAGIVLMTIKVIPDWIGAVVCLVIAALEAIAIIKAKAASDIVSNRDENIKQKTLFIREMTAEAEILMNNASSEEEKRELKKLYEAFRYSDPVSNEKTISIENAIKEDIGVLKSCFSVFMVSELIQLISSRNRFCKLEK